MNRNNWRESLIGGRSIPVPSQNHRRGHSFNGLCRDADEKLDLFSKNRHALSVVSPDESSEVSVKLGRLSLGSVKQVKSGLDDLLSSTDGGKHDYDWLLTPPGTPLVPSSEGNELQHPTVAPRRSSLSRSVSTTKASRLSVSQSEGHNSSRPARSSSVTRPSISSSQYSTYSSNKSSSILNTSLASVSSYIRPPSPITRSPSIARTSTPSHPTFSSHSSTPSRTRPAPTSSVIDKSRPSQNSRSSTPTSRQQIPTNLSSGVTRSSSRPSTPTRRNPVPSLAASSSTSTSAGRVSNGRISSTPSRPSSPGARVRSQQQPIVPPDFPSDTPPNLRTTLPDRPLSAGRSRPGVVAMKTNPETTVSTNVPRRHSSPMTSRGRITDSPGKTRLHSNGRASEIPEPRRVSHPLDSGMRKPVKSASTDGNGFGRSISKKSLDMAIRHMDIRNGNGSTRPLAGTTLFPQSIRSAAPKSQSVRSSNTSEPFNNNLNRDISDSRSYTSRGTETGNESNNGRYSAKLSEVDMYESSRYDAILLKEDLKDVNWLHSVDDKSDHGPIFDNGFEPLPEPFDLL